MLDHIERAGLFLVPLDEGRGWWRDHDLFADLLRARLEQEQPSRGKSCTRPRPPGPMSMTWPMMRCGTRWRPGTPPGRRGWSSGTSRRCFAAARARLCIGGFPRCPRSRYATGRACAWPRRPAPLSASGWKRSRAWRMTPNAPLRSGATNRMSRRSPGRSSVLANVPAGIAFLHAVLARQRGDPALAAASTGRPWCYWASRSRLIALYGALERGGAGLATRRPTGRPNATWQEAIRRFPCCLGSVALLLCQVAFGLPTGPRRASPAPAPCQRTM